MCAIQFDFLKWSTNSLWNNFFYCFIVEKKLVTKPKIKLLLGLVSNFIKWISEKYIYMHFRLDLWIIKWIYNCIQFYPQAQPAKTSSVHVKRILHIFFKNYEQAAKQHWIYMLISKNNNLSIKLYSGECSIIQKFCLMYILPSKIWIYTSIFLVLSEMSSSSSLTLPLWSNVIGGGWEADRLSTL